MAEGPWRGGWLDVVARTAVRVALPGLRIFTRWAADTVEELAEFAERAEPMWVPTERMREVTRRAVAARKVVRSGAPDRPPEPRSEGRKAVSRPVAAKKSAASPIPPEVATRRFKVKRGQKHQHDR